MKRVIVSTEMLGMSIMAMANIEGNDICRPTNMPFSFYFSSKRAFGTSNRHGPRVKPVFSPSDVKAGQAGVLKLCDDWDYVPGKDEGHISDRKINHMKEFFRDNIVLFMAVWEEQLPDNAVVKYLDGRIDIHELVTKFDFYEDYHHELDKVETVSQLDEICRQHHLVNFHGN